MTRWKMTSTNYIDYVVIYPKRDTKLCDLTGKVPKMPENLLGLWQSKLRYRSPNEVMDVVKNTMLWE